jgi:hypothetical protein
MNRLLLKKISLLLFILTIGIGSCDAQIFHRSPDKKLFGKSSHSSKEAKVKEPKKVLKAKKEQEAKKKKLKSDYDKSVKQSQKRTYDIQSPDVQERMKNNQKKTEERDKAKKKNVRKTTKSAGKKYN